MARANNLISGILVPRKKRGSFIFSLLLIALLIRLFFFIVVINQQPHKFDLQDLDGYVHIARNLINHGVYSREPAPPYIPDITRPPVYPITLAGLMVLSGFNGNIIVLFQVLLGVALVVLTYALALELEVENHLAFAASIFIALDPLLILLGHYFLSETLFLVEWLAALWLFLRFLNNQKLLFLISSSILTSAATLTRPILQFYPVLITLFIFILLPRQRFVPKIRYSILFLVIFFGLIIPWEVRNQNVSGIFTLSTISDTNLYYYRAKAVLADAENITQETAMMRLNDEINTLKLEQGTTPGDIQKYMRARAVEIMLQHPTQTVKMTVVGAIRLLADPGFSLVCTALDANNLTPECFPGEATMLNANIFSLMWTRFLTMNLFQKITLIIGTIIMLLLYAGASLGIILLVRQKRWLPLSIILGSILYFIVLSSGAESLYRLRVPILPLLAILTGISLGYLVSLRRSVENSELQKSRAA